MYRFLEIVVAILTVIVELALLIIPALLAFQSSPWYLLLYLPSGVIGLFVLVFAMAITLIINEREYGEYY